MRLCLRVLSKISTRPLRQRGVDFKSLQDDAIDTTTASGELMFMIFSALAQFERRLIQERTRAGLTAARARGRTLSISKATFYRYLALAEKDKA